MTVVMEKGPPRLQAVCFPKEDIVRVAPTTHGPRYWTWLMRTRDLQNLYTHQEFQLRLFRSGVGQFRTQNGAWAETQ